MKEDYITYLRSFTGKNKVIMVVAGVLIFDEENRLLLELRSDNQKWGHPGGYMELGETIEETAKREIFEETGLTLGEVEIFGIYSGKKQERILQNGDEVSLVKIMFTCKEFSGQLRKSEESLQLKFFPLDKLPDIWPAQKAVFKDLLSGASRPIIK